MMRSVIFVVASLFVVASWSVAQSDAGRERRKQLVAAIDKTKAMRVVVSTEVGDAKVSVAGLLVDSSGIVVAAEELLRMGKKFRIRLDDDSELPATKVFDKDGASVFKVVREQPFPAVELGGESKVEFGDTVVAIGYAGREASVHVAIVSGVDIEILGDKYLRIDTSSCGGIASGIVVDLSGTVVGLISKANGIAIPARRLKEIVGEARGG